MSTKSVTTNPPPGRTDDWDASEGAPSVVRRDDPNIARVFGSVGASAVVFGAFALLWNLSGRAIIVGTGWASFAIALGLCGLLFHATFDWDVQFRRLYMVFGYLMMVAGIFLMVLPYPNKSGDLFGTGFLLDCLGLFFLLGFLRNEDDPWLRNLAHTVLGGLGASMAIVGLFGGNLTVNFLVPFGELLAILGLVYLIAFIVSRGIGDDRAYLTGVGMGCLGGLVFLIALGRAIFAAHPVEYIVPSGAVLLSLGFVYAAASFALCSDWSLAVLTRRELGAFFFSPMAYIVLTVCVIAHGFSYLTGVDQLLDEEATVFEPIVLRFVLQLTPVLFVMCVVPVLTMRSLAEERRSGTLEVLLTSPVSEVSVILSKFLAALVMFLVTWLPLGLYLAYMRVDTGQTFDYRPLLSFFVILLFCGGAFVSMGIFFSSLTRSQLASGVLTLVGMVTMTLFYIILQGALTRRGSGSTAWTAVLKHVSYLDSWIDTLQGALQPTYLIFFASLTVLWLFLAVKVLEARKWAG
jgi:ABC-2 type transport system permease protein